MVRFKFLSGDVNWRKYGGKFVSQRLNNGEFDYWLVINVINWLDYERHPENTYSVELQAVSPDSVSQADKDRAISSSCGWDSLDESNPLDMVQVLSEHGIFAQLWDASGNNIAKLMQAARHEAQLIEMLFGFYMDRPENRLGQDGWGLIRGESIREFFASRDNE